MAALVRSPVPFWVLFVMLAALLAVPAPAAWAEDEAEAEEEEEEEESPLTAIEAQEARPLLDALKKVAKKKNANDVLPKLEPLEDVYHESFDKTLIKLLKHPSSLVAVKTAEMWEWRIRPKNVKKVWKASWGEKKNARRYRVKTLVLRALARAKHILDKRQYADVVRDWRSMRDAPSESYGEAMVDVCWYFELTGDKRHCRWLAEELTYQYENADPSNPATPPASTQEQRWKQQQHTKAAAASALLEITGEEFDTTAKAKAWFKANEKTFGFKW